MLNKKPSLVIFDMDGLMFDSEKVAFSSLKKALNEIGEDIDHAEYMTLIGKSSADFHRYYLQKMPNHDPSEFDRRALDLIMIHYAEQGVPLKDGLFELLDWLIENGIKRVVATSTSRDMATETLRLAGVYERFDDFIFGDMVHRSKPNPEIFELICDRNADSRSDAVVLEDSRNGILASHAAGIPVIMVPDLIQPTEELLELAECKLNDLFEVRDYFAALPGRA